MNSNILRHYPAYKTLPLKLMFKPKVKEEHKSYNNIKLWRKGVNPFTGRKIKIGGKTHKAIAYQAQEPTIKREFAELYHKMWQDWDNERKKVEKEIEEYNTKVSEVIEKINLLKTWDEFVIFEDKKYGIPNTYGDICRKNGCLGVMKLVDYDPCRCSTCENWRGCNHPRETYYYKCTACDFEYSNTKQYSSYPGNYK